MVMGAAVLGLGYLGRPLAERLYLSGYSMAAVKHRMTSDDINLPIDVQYFDFNRIGLHADVFGRFWAEKKVWICLLPPSPFPDYDACLKSWCDLALSCGVEHLVYSSSVSVYGGRCRECDENTVPEPETESASKVLAAEQVFLNSGVKHVDILRLGGLYSADRHPLNSILRRHKTIFDADQPVNMLHKDAALNALFAAVSKPGGIRIRNIVDESHPTKRAFYRQQAVSLGLPVPEFEAGETGGKTVRSLFADLRGV